MVPEYHYINKYCFKDLLSRFLFIFLFGISQNIYSGTDVATRDNGTVAAGGTISYCLNANTDSIWYTGSSTKMFASYGGTTGLIVTAATGWAYYNPSNRGVGKDSFYYELPSRKYYVMVLAPTASTIAFSATAKTSYCYNTGSYLLSSLFDVTPAGGTFYLDNVAATNLNTAAYATQHTYNISYRGPACSAMSPTLQITVYPYPVISFVSFPSTCSSVDSVNLVGRWSPIGGTYSGTGVVGNYFHPSAGTQPITYSLTNNGCTSNSTRTFTINPIPTVNFTGWDAANYPPPLSYCGTGVVPDVTLTAVVNPGGGVGTFTGAGIVASAGLSGTFRPSSAGIGFHNIIFRYTVAGCTNSDTQTVKVGTEIFINGLAASYCANAGIKSFTYTPVSAVPGDGVSGGASVIDAGGGSATFNPAVAGAGSHTIQHKYTDALGCVNIQNHTVIVNPVPVANFSGFNAGMQYCSNDANVTINGNFPLAGTFTGPAGKYILNADSSATVYINTLPVSGSPYSFTYKYTNSYGCTDDETKQITILQAPSTFTVSGNGSYCEGTSGLPIVLSGSQGAGIEYQLYKGVSTDSLAIDGTTSAIKWYNRQAGVYTVRARDKGNMCVTNMINSATVIQNPTPALYTVTGTGSYCAGGTGLSVKLSSSDIGTIYQLLLNGSPIDTVAGTGSEIDFGLKTVAGTYTVYATLTTGGQTCGRMMAASAVISIVPLPVAYPMVGGDSAFCEGMLGVYMQLSGAVSDAGITYTLLRDGVSTGTSKLSTGGHISLGFHTTSGTYTIVGTNSLGCPTTMSGSRKVTQNLKPLNAESPVGATSVCKLTSHMYYCKSIPYATSYTWTVPAGATPVYDNNNHDTVTITFGPGIAPGIKNIIVNGTNSCGSGGVATLPITVMSIPATPGAITGTVNVCQNTNFLDYTIRLMAGVTSYTWTTPTGTTTYASDTLITVSYGPASHSGDITVKANNACGSSLESKLTINVTDAPVVTLNAPSGIITCDPTPVNVSVTCGTAGVTYAWTTSNGGFIGASDPTLDHVNAYSPGNYNITVTEPSALSCKTTGTIKVDSSFTAPNNGSILTSTPNYITCNNPVVTLTATSTFPNVSYSWLPNPGIASISGPLNENVSVNLPGKYDVQIINNVTKCVRSASITIKDSSLAPTVTAPNPASKISCKNKTVTLSSTSNGVSYLWTTTGGGHIGTPASPVTTVDSAGTYRITVTGSNGCTNSTTVQVFKDFTSHKPTILVPKTLTCKQNLDTLTCFPSGGSVLWTGPGIFSADPTLQNVVVNAPGTYKVVETSYTTGCKDSSEITVNQNIVNPVVSFVLPPTITCSSPSVNITGNATSTKNSYTWSTLDGNITTGVYSKVVTVNAAGTYKLTVKDSTNGCSGFNTTTISTNKVQPGAVIDAHGDVTCSQPQPTLVGHPGIAVATVNYQWTTVDGNIFSGPTSATPKVSEGGTYKVVITNFVNGCKDSTTTYVNGDTAKPAISMLYNPSKLTCSTTNVGLSGSAANSSYLWTGPAGATFTPNNLSSTPLVNRPGKYYFTATSTINGCSKTDSVTVGTLYTLPTGVSISSPATLLTCNVPSITLTGSSTTAGATYNWYYYSGGAPVLLLGNTNKVNVTTLGNYKLVAYHPTTGCEDSSKITITRDISVPSITFPAALPYPITCDSTTSKIFSTVIPATSAITWSGAATFTPSNSDPNPRVNADGIFTITAVHPVTGCSASTTRTVGLNKNKPIFTIAAPAVVTCSALSVLLDATIPAQIPAVTSYTPSWSSADGAFLGGITTNLDVSATEGGTYTLTIKNNDNGCSNSVNTTVTADTTKPTVTVNPITIPANLSCANTSVQLSGFSIPGTQLKWTGPGAVTNDATSNPTVSTIGTYTLTATVIASGCTNTGSVTVTRNNTAPAKPNILAPDVLTCSRDTVNLIVAPADPDVEYTWSTPGTGIIIDGETFNAKVTSTGMYIVTAKSTINGCTNADTVTVTDNKAVPAVNITGGPYVITCTATTLQLNGVSATGINPVWSTNGGGHIDSYPTGPFTPKIDAAGDYTLTVEDPLTGCKASKSITVTKSADVPAPNYNPFARLLTCSNLQDTLYGEPTKASEKFTWLSDSSFVSGQNTTTPIVNKAATYVLRVEDTITHCVGIVAIVVNRNVQKPVINYTTPQMFTCDRSEVQISASTPVTNSSFAWTTGGAGSIKAGYSNVSNPIVLTPATYRVTVTDLDNSCTAFKDITIGLDNTPPSVDVFDSPEKISCKSPLVNLQGSSNPATNIVYTWTGPGSIYNNGTNNPAVTAPGKYILSVKKNSNGCIGKDSVIVAIDTVRPSIWVYNNPSQLNCQKDTVYVTGNSPNDVTYLWTGGTFSDKTAKAPYVYDDGTFTLTVTSNINGCKNSKNVTVTKDTLKPAAPIAADVYTCFGSPADTLKAVGTFINWYKLATIVPANNIKSGSWLVPTETAIGNYHYYVTQTDAVNHCESPAYAVTYSVKSLPITPLTFDSSVCQGLPNPALRVSPTFAGAVVNWYNSATGAPVSTGNNQYIAPASVSAAATYTFYATQTDAYGCESARVPVYLTIHALPNKPTIIQPSTSICFGAANLSLSVTGTRIKWYDDPTKPDTIASGNSYVPIVINANTYKFYVTQTNAYGCESAIDTLTYIIKKLPYKQLVTSAGDVYCEGQSGINVGLNGSGLNTSYSLIRNGTTSIPPVKTGTGASIDFGVQTEGRYTVVADSNSCTSIMTGGVTISVNPLPLAAGTISGLSSVCEGTSNVTYTISPVANASSYNWNIPAGATITSGLNSNSIIVDFNAGSNTGNINVYAINGCGTGAISANKQVVINKLPAIPGNIKLNGRNNMVCLGDSNVIYEVDPVANATSYEWVIPSNSTITYGDGSRSIKVKFSQSVTTGSLSVKVRAVNSCGTGPYSNPYTVNVSSNPFVFAGDEQNLCGTTATMNGNAIPAGGSGTWQVISGFAILSDSSQSNSTASSISKGENLLTWTVKNNFGCSSIDTVKILNNQVPVEAGNNQNVCFNPIVLYANAAPSGATGIWHLAVGSHATIDNTSNPNATASDFTYGQNKLYWTIIKNGCSSTDSVIITGNQPTKPDIIDYQETCTNTATLIGNQPVNGTGRWHLVSGGGQILPDDARVTTITNLSRDKNIVVWEISSGNGCSLADTMIIQNNTVAAYAGDDAEICDNKYTLHAGQVSSGETGSWSGNGRFSDNNSFNATVTNMVIGTNQYVWTVKSNSCYARDTVVITSLLSLAEAGNDMTIGGSSTILNAQAPVVGTGQWSIIQGNGTFVNRNLFNTTVNDLKPGVNKLLWTVDNKGCLSIDSVNVINGTLETVNAGRDTIICTNILQLNASKPVYGIGKWTVLKGGAANDFNKNIYNPQLTGIFPDTTILKWTVSLSANLSSSDTMMIINNSPISAKVGQPHVYTCSNDASISGNRVDGINVGVWTRTAGSGDIADPTQYNTTVSNLGWGDNRFTWTVRKGSCPSSAEVIVSNNKATVATVGTSKQITTCDDFATLYNNSPIPDAEKGYWTISAGYGTFDKSNSNVSGLAHGSNKFTWIIESTKNRNCRTSDEIEIISYKPTVPKVSSYPIVSCVDSFLITANKCLPDEIAYWTRSSGGGTFANANSSSTWVKNIAPTNVYSWTIQNTLDNSCKASADLLVYYGLIIADAGDSLFTTCSDSMQLNAHNSSGSWSVASGSSYFSNSSDPFAVVRNLSKGTNVLKWSVKNTLFNKTCISSDNVTVINNSPSDAIAGGTQDICSSTTTMRATPPVIGRGTWTKTSGSGDFANNTSPTTSVTNIQYGTNIYKWTVTNNGCISEKEVTINNNKPLNVDAYSDLTTLCTDSVGIHANVPADTGFWTIVKGYGDIDPAYSTFVRGLAPDTNIIRWTVKNKNCFDYKDVTVINNMPTTSKAGSTRIVCSNNFQLDGNIPVQGTGIWTKSSGSGVIADTTLYNSMLTNVGTGANIFRWTITKKGCVSYSEVKLVNDLPSDAYAGTDQSLCDSTTTLNAMKPAVGSGYWTVLNGYAEFDDSSQSNTTVRYLGQGTNVLLWTTKHGICKLSDTVKVVNNLTDVYAGPDQAIYDDSTMLTANKPIRGVGAWSLDGGNGELFTPDNFETLVRGLTEGVNTFTWSVNIDGCTSSDQVKIRYYRLPTASFSVSKSEGCIPLEVKFTNTTLGNSRFKWTFGEADSTSTEKNPVYIYSVPGTYKAILTIFGQDNIPVTKEQYISAYERPKIKFDMVPDSIYLPKDVLRCYNYSEGGETYLWNFGDGSYSEEFNPSHAYKDSGYYRVSLIVTTGNNCSDSLVVENAVHVIQRSRLTFPNSFTPNVTGSKGGFYSENDYNNDVFYPIVLMGDITEYDFQIYNRWGILVFESKDIKIGWDGYYKQKLANEDVYIYRVTGRYNNGEHFDIKGDFLLIRRQ